MIEELEQEVLETRFIASRVGGGDLKKLEDERNNLKNELESLQKRFDDISNELSMT